MKYTTPKVSKYSNRNWNNNTIQFPRLIAEMQSLGHFNLSNMGEIALEMDLQLADVQELVSRACDVWDKINQSTR